MKKYKIGYTQGTFDMFHIGHLNLLRHAKEQCEKLIVGINSDSLVEQYKNKTPIVNEIDRAEIVKALRCVDEVILCDTLKKSEIWNKLQFNAIFIGDDWKGNTRWRQMEGRVERDIWYTQHWSLWLDIRIIWMTVKTIFVRDKNAY